MRRRRPGRIATPLDVVLGAAYLLAGLVPIVVPAAWRGLVVDLALVSLGAAFVMPLAGAAVSRLGDDPRRTRGMVVALGLLLCVLVPQALMFRDPATPPFELLLPSLVVLPGMWSLWRAAGETWPGLRLERRVAAVLPLSAVVVGALFFALLHAGWIGDHAIVVMSGLSLLVVAASRNLLASRSGVPPPPPPPA